MNVNENLIDGLGLWSELINDNYYNASYIKSAFQENFNHEEQSRDPYGLIIACEGPKQKKVPEFWKMIC